ncbi:MAG: thioredoxin family protein [Myxococcota bacterium]|nr:thioredoxin family protein [Myxococcota bacterium]
MEPVVRPTLPTGLVAFVKRDCPTCELVTPVLAEIAKQSELTVFSQDDPAFPEGLDPRDETDLALSWQHGIEAVPTLLRVEDGAEVMRAIGWHRADWEALTGIGDLGPGLPESRPGCGSLSVDPTREPELRRRFEGGRLQSRRIEVAALEDEQEAIFARGWTDGHPVVAPTESRVLAMLDGTGRAPDEIVVEVPPDLVPCTVEKVAVNAVLAGCRPAYLPVVLAAVEAVCNDTFNMHGVQATTMGICPVLIVNGPIRRTLGMNAGIGVLAPGNRANASIGRALQLVIRNVGGSRPGEIDRSTFGHPGKLGSCFAEDEEASPWEPLSADAGFAPGTNTVTAFAGEGPRLVMDQLSRDPESLVRSLAACLRTVHHPKMGVAMSALLIVGPEHGRVFREAGWSKQRLKEALNEALLSPGSAMMRGADGIAEGLPLPEAMRDAQIPKFRPGHLHVAFAGGAAGLFSVIIGGWLTGPEGSQVVTKEVRG